MTASTPMAPLNMPSKTSDSRFVPIVRQLESRGVMPDRPLTLEPMIQAFDKISHLIEFDKKHTIVIAGTNGKGSVCASLEALLLDANQSVGTYTSPHLMQTTERIRVNGVDLSEQEFCDVYEQLDPLVLDLKLSHFEMLTLMAVRIFFAKPKPKNPPTSYSSFSPSGSPSFSPSGSSTQDTHAPQWKLFEVGLGGTWDATNAISHAFSIITSIGLDHQNLLGADLVSIAKNKLGIISQENCVIHAHLQKELWPLIENVRSSTQSHWSPQTPFKLEVSPGAFCDTSKHGCTATEPSFTLVSEYGRTKLALSGERSAQNAAIALTAFKVLGFDPSIHQHALEYVRWNCRMQKFELNALRIYLSGDHNELGIDTLIDLLKYYARDHLYILVGIGQDKQADSMLSKLSQLPNASVALTETPFRGYKLADYGPWLKKAVIAHKNPYQAMDAVLALAQPRDMVLVTGSLYLTGHILQYLQELAVCE